MKQRHAEWPKLSTSAKTNSTASPIRMIDLPGFRELEDKLLLYSSSRGVASPETEEAARALSIKTFGIARAETEFVWPNEYWECEEFSPEWERIEEMYLEYERCFETIQLSDEDTAAVLQQLGLDFRDDRGFPLRCTKMFSRQAEAAARGIKGRVPDRASVGLERWESAMQEAARSHLAKKRKG